MDAAPGVADLRAGTRRRAVFPTRRAHRATHGLGDRLVRFEIDIRAGPKPLIEA
jgi:hypothetical protein